MTELEKLIRAKEYMDKLAEGIDPVGGLPLPEDTALNNVRLSRCFFFVSDILRQVIENGGTVSRRSVKNAALPPFVLPEEMRWQIEISEEPIMITKFTARITDLVDAGSMRKLKVTAFTSWLVEKGYLYEDTVNEKKNKRPTQAGEGLGIFAEARDGQGGGYIAILYKEKAQRFLIENLDQIIALSNGE